MSSLLLSSPSTMSLFTARESMRACMRKSFDAIISSRISHLPFLSDIIPYALIIATSSSRSDIMIISFPTTAMVLSTTPSEYFCAEAVSATAANAKAAASLLNQRMSILFCNYKFSVNARIFKQIVFQSRHEGLLSRADYHVLDERRAVFQR